MNARIHVLGLIAAAMLMLTGCASTHAATDPPAPQTTPTVAAMPPGMVMPDGSTMGAGTTGSGRPPTSAAAAIGRPTAAETMICAAETRSDITNVLGLASAPTATARWANHLYTCTYALPTGTFIISVKQSANPPTAQAYFADLRTSLGATQTLHGLGQGSYGTTGGTVVLIKDSDTLTVDATRLPAVLGAQQAKRFDFAYEIASDILGCWTGG
jgi:hypothetical protein